MCENKTIVVKTNNMCKNTIMIYMLKQLIDVKSNKIFVLQTVGKGTSCPACVWQTDLHTGTQAHTADKWQLAISRFTQTSYLNLCSCIKKYHILRIKNSFSINKQLSSTCDCNKMFQLFYELVSPRFLL